MSPTRKQLVFDAYLLHFSERYGIHLPSLRAMLEGTRDLPAYIFALFEDDIGLSPSAWRAATPRVTVPRSPEGKGKKAETVAPHAQGLVSSPRGGHATDVRAQSEGRAGQSQAGRRRRRNPSPVHAVLDKLRWTVQDLCDNVQPILGRPVSRASMQFWASGVRMVGPAGKSKPQAVAAPREVREAAEKATRGLLKAGFWPNVEDETLDDGQLE